MNYAFEPHAIPCVPIDSSDKSYPVRRIFCVGRNYAAHAAEMGTEVDREAPWYFTKSAHALCQSGARVPYALGTENYHYEMELVVAIGAPAQGVSVGEVTFYYRKTGSSSFIK